MPRNELDDILSRDRMESAQLTAKDVCTIIKTAKEMGVSSLAFLSLKVTFGDGTGISTHSMKPPREIPIPESSKRLQGQELERMLLDETKRLKDEQLSTLPILDPEKYEELMIEGDLSGGTEEKETDDY